MPCRLNLSAGLLTAILYQLRIVVLVNVSSLSQNTVPIHTSSVIPKETFTKGNDWLFPPPPLPLFLSAFQAMKMIPSDPWFPASILEAPSLCSDVRGHGPPFRERLKKKIERNLSLP